MQVLILKRNRSHVYQEVQAKQATLQPQLQRNKNFWCNLIGDN